MRAMVADPGVGREEDPIGSKGWAERVRLRIQGIVNDVASQPDSLRRYVELIQNHRAWTLMNKPDGSYFRTWDEFCEHRQPWGLGKSWEELRPFVEAVQHKNATALAIVTPAAHGNRFLETAPGAVSRKDQFLRAILRAPAEVQDLYREGLIGQKVAAKLGPKDPAKAPSREAIVDALKTVPRERKAIDAKVREVLGAKKDRVAELVRAVARLTDTQRARFYDQLEKAISQRTK